MPLNPNRFDENDGKEWSEMDLRDLRAHLKHGGSAESAAVLLCRQGTIEEVREKARELEAGK